MTDMKNLAQQARFICGHPKSGTSLLLTLLDSHPQLVAYPEETGYFRWFSEYSQDYSLEEKVKLIKQQLSFSFHWDPRSLHSRQEEFPDRNYSDISYKAVCEEFSKIIQHIGVSEDTLLPAAILAYGQISGQLGSETRMWLEKTPFNELYAQQIFRLWPAAKCIHLIRDPRDAFASYRKKHEDWHPQLFAQSWLRSAQASIMNQTRFGDKQYLVVRYEDLLLDPRSTIGTVREFLEIEDNPILLSPTRSGKPWGGNSMFGESFQGVSTSPLGRFRTSLSQAEILRLEIDLQKYMERFGYQLDHKIGMFARIASDLWHGVRSLKSRWSRGDYLGQYRRDEE